MSDSAPKPLKLDVNFFRPFIDGTLKTLKIQCSVDAHPGRPMVKGPTTPTVKYDIAGVIGLTSNAFHGTLSLCFPGPVFLQVMGNMLGEKFDTITPDLRDGASELMNIIFGQAKIVLNNQGYDVRMAIPTVVTGTNIETSHVSKGTVILLPFETGAGPFFIEICAEGAVHT